MSKREEGAEGAGRDALEAVVSKCVGAGGARYSVIRGDVVRHFPTLKAAMEDALGTARPLPCPFCGAAAEVERWDCNGPLAICLCNNEGCPANPSTLAVYADDAVARWNTRAAPQAPEGRP